MQSSSHLLPCKLPGKFISWASTKTNIPNYIPFFAVPTIVETVRTNNATFQLG